jgi:acyl-[acyl-carrier-protein] desaturase
MTQSSAQNPDVEVTSSRFEVIKSIEPFVGEQLGSLLKPVEESWQPSDFLPDLSGDGWHERVTELRTHAAALPDDVLVVLIGDMITEEALPSYQTWLNRLKGITDVNGASATAWARWSRGWTSEENRHGDILNRYLYLTGRANMQAVERTIHYLLNSGFDPLTENDPYLGFVYTSFQERATRISHRNVATLAMRAGEAKLHEICGLIAGDEARHEKAYKLFMTKIFEADPSNALLSFAEMMKKKITMPAHLMFDGEDLNLYAKFSKVAQRIGVYTVIDYSEIIDDLVKHWQIAGLTGLNGAAAKAQDYLCTLSERYQKLASRVLSDGAESFSWIYGRTVA